MATLTNNENVALNVGIATSTDFTQTNGCPSPVPAFGSCNINVSFAPTASRMNNGTLTVNYSGFASPVTAKLSGTGK